MKKIKHGIIFLLPFSVLSLTVVAQNKIIDSLQQDLKISKEDTNKVNLLNNLSVRLYRTASSSQAIKYTEEALVLARKLDFQTGIINSYNTVGRHYEYLGNYPEALKNHFLALKLAEEKKDKKLTAYCNLLIGVDYEEQGRSHPNASLRKEFFDEALKYDFVSLNIYKEIGDKRGIGLCYTDIGVVYMDQGNYDEALKNYYADLEIAEEIGNKGSVATTYLNIGDAYLRQGNYTKALENLFIAIKMAQAIGHEKNLSDCYISVGTIYGRLKEESRATQFLNDGLTLAKKIRNKEAIVPAYKILEELDSTDGNWLDAYQHYKLFVLYRDSLNNEENTKKILQSQLQFGFDKKEDSLKQKQLLTEVKLQSQQKQKSFYLIGAILLAALLLFVFLDFRNQKKINKLSHIAYAKEKAELELHSLRAQLNPHFMFNSLNAIQELILKEDFENSHTYLARFAKLLRMLLENAEKPFVQLSKEVDFLELYLSLEKLRIPGLNFLIDIDPAVNAVETFLPNMVLQPYIENALWHGLSPKNGDKKLELIVYKQNGSVIYDIKDNGVGRKKAGEFKSLYRKEHKSKGMELLTKRFNLLNDEFGSKIKTQIRDVMNDSEVAGTEVSLAIPESLSAKQGE